MIVDLQVQSKKYQDEANANLEDVKRVKTRQAETDKELKDLAVGVQRNRHSGKKISSGARRPIDARKRHLKQKCSK